MLDLTCENCGKQFQRRKGQESEHAFCSRDCYWKSDYRSQTIAAGNRKRNPEAQQTRPCANCGADVTRYVSTGQSEFFCSRDCRWNHRKHPRSRQIKGGYALVYVGRGYPGATKTGHIFEHRKVMQDLLGRPLRAEENVHHKNGVRADNRPENLELWSRSQPHGQRVEDKIAWAREFLELYQEREVLSDDALPERELGGARQRP